MNAQKTNTISYRKAWIAFVATFSCLMIYVLACVMSPPAWSPDSSKIAILVTPPGDKPDKYAIFTYDIATGEHVLLDEVKADGSLSTPAWSPDGTWITYYRVEPNNPVGIPPVDSNSAPVVTQQTLSETKELYGQVGTGENKERPVEENKMLPSLLFDLFEGLAQNEKKTDFIDMKLMLIRPDGSEKKTLHTVKLESENNGGDNSVALLRPVWSKDSKRIFYMRGFKDIWYVGSMDISTGKTYLHLLTSGVSIAVSPDDEWIASFIQDDHTLIAARVDGSMCKYFKTEMEFDDNASILFDGLFWSPDSKKVFVVGKDWPLHAVDIASAKTELYKDPNDSNTAYYTMSGEGDKLYYLASSEAFEEGLAEGTVSLCYMNLRDRSTGTVFSLPQFSEADEVDGDGSIFSISPNGKVVIQRLAIQEDHDIQKSVLLFYDGKTQKVVYTDRWLLKPLYSDSSLTFEEKLISNWSGEKGQIAIAKGSLQRTYRLTWSENDKEHHAVANLVQLKGMLLLGVFFDESLLENRDTSESHLLPDMFIRLVQIEPKLLMQVIGYDRLAEILKGAGEFIRPEDIGTEDIDEYERVDSLPDSSGVSEK